MAEEYPRAEESPRPSTVSTSVDVETTATSSPYKNLFVPLIVVPALIVGAIVLVFVFFGAISGREASLSENLDRVMQGGAGDHTQAAYNMARQIAENHQAQRKGEPAPWPVEPDFLPKLRRAWESAPNDEPLIRLVLATLLAHLGDPEGVPSLIALLDLSPTEDADGQIRFHALANLGAIGDARALEPIRRVLETSDDPGLRSVAAIAMQGIPGEEARGALLGALEDPDFEVRANAALGLAARGDDAGAKLLRAMLDPATYADERGRDASKFSQERRVREARIEAIGALAKLRRPEDRSEIVRVADEEKDLPVREAAMKALEGWR